MDALNVAVDGFKVIPSLAVIKRRPVYVDSGRYSQLRSDGRALSIEEVSKTIYEGYGRLHYLDILSFRTGEPDLSTIRELSGFNEELWTDVGARSSDPLIDAIMAGATTCVVSTKMMASLSEFASAFELTDDLVVQVDMDGGIISPDPSVMAMAPKDFCREMMDLGIKTLVLDMDLPADARAMAIEEVVEALSGGVEVYAGMDELSEAEALKAVGAAGGIISCSKVLKGV